MSTVVISQKVSLERGQVFLAWSLDALVTDLGVFQFEFWTDWAKGAQKGTVQTKRTCKLMQVLDFIGSGGRI